VSSSNTLSICRVHCRPWDCQSRGAAEWEAGLWNPPSLCLFDRNRTWSFAAPSLLLISLACNMFFRRAAI